MEQFFLFFISYLFTLEDTLWYIIRCSPKGSFILNGKERKLYLFVVYKCHAIIYVFT